MLSTEQRRQTCIHLSICYGAISYPSSIAGWIPVTRGLLFDHDLDNVSLEIKTNSTSGTDELMWLIFRNAHSESAGGFGIKFSSTPKYYLPQCTTSSWINFPTTLPTATYKIWRITLDRRAGIRVLVRCNEELVLNVMLSDQVCTNYRSTWSSYWSRIVTKIYFYKQDNASDYYKLDQGNLCIIRCQTI